MQWTTKGDQYFLDKDFFSKYVLLKGAFYHQELEALLLSGVTDI